MIPFLTAVWSDLILASYAIPDDVLAPYLRTGLEPDRWRGSAYCSLVAFRFEQARVLGWSLPYPPGLCDFPEVNLRFYVREGERRGVMFVRELVPNVLVAGMARRVYNEPYDRARMTSRVTQMGDLRRVRHDFTVDGAAQMIAVTARGAAQTPAEATFDAWVKEQEWGFGRRRSGRATRFRVRHPAWRTYGVEDSQIGIDFGHLYGPSWRFLQPRVPDSVILAEGSAVSVAQNENS